MSRVPAYLLILTILAPAVAFSQHWQRLANMPGYATCGYFWSATSGLVAFSSSYNPPNSPTLFKTKDGKTWRQIPLPSTLRNHGFISSIFFRNQSVGWFSVNEQNFPYGQPCVYQTSDGGETWSPVSGSSTWISLMELSGRLVYSVGGVSALSDSVCLISGAASTQRNPPPFGQTYVTSDAGTTWKPTPLIAEAWGCYAQKSSGYLYVYPEGGGTVSGVRIDSSRLWRSIDTGKTWERAATVPNEHTCGTDFADQYPTTGDLEGAGDAIYVQTTCMGMYKSMDRGQSWLSIGGPSNHIDTRFCTVQTCRGGTVIAFGSDGTIWRTIDGGDGTLTEDDTVAFSIKSFPKLTACNIDSGVVRFTSNYCASGFELLAATLELDTAHFKVESLPALPETLGGLTADSIVVRFDPQKQAGTFTTHLHLMGRINLPDSSYDFDTVIVLTATAQPERPRISAGASELNFEGLSTCGPGADSVIHFTNTGCVSDTITSVVLNGLGFSYDTTALPIVLAPDSSYSLVLHFSSPVAGTYQGTLEIGARSQGLTGALGISLAAFVQQGTGLLSLADTMISAGRVSICADTTISVLIENTGCDTLRLSGFRLMGDTDYVLVSGTGDTLLPPNGTRTIAVRFVPSNKNLRRGAIAFHSQNLHGSDPGIDTSITVFGTGAEGVRLVSQSLNSIDFGSWSVCEQPDSAFTLTNTGCDTLTISSADITGLFSYEGTLPIVLKPGESTSITVHSDADTTGHPTTVTGTLQFTTTAQNSLPPITLRRGFVYPARLKIEAVANASAKAGEEVKFKVLLEGDVPKGMSALYFDLSNDDDVLSFVSSTGVSVLNTTGGTPVATRTFKLSPVTDTGVIGELTFHTYLAKANTTSLTLSNLHFDYPNVTVPPDCIASIEGSGSNFTYSYQCGEGLIQQFMLSGSFTGQNYPNPFGAVSGYKTTIPFAAIRSGVAHLDVLNQMGSIVLSQEQTVSEPGANCFLLNAQTLLAGQYFYRLRVPGEPVSETRQLVLIR